MKDIEIVRGGIASIANGYSYPCDCMGTNGKKWPDCMCDHGMRYGIRMNPDPEAVSALARIDAEIARLRDELATNARLLAAATDRATEAGRRAKLAESAQELALAAKRTAEEAAIRAKWDEDTMRAAMLEASEKQGKVEASATAWKDLADKLQRAQNTSTEYKCFHCGVTFIGELEARSHFGTPGDGSPTACLQEALVTAHDDLTAIKGEIEDALSEAGVWGNVECEATNYTEAIRVLAAPAHRCVQVVRELAAAHRRIERLEKAYCNIEVDVPLFRECRAKWGRR